MAAKSKKFELKYDFCRNLMKRLTSENTPDFLDRKHEGKILVFIHGREKEWGEYHRLIEKSEFVSMGELSAPFFNIKLARSNEGDIPLLFKEEVGYYVKGEVWYVDPITLLVLDRHFQNGVQTVRAQHFAWLDDVRTQGGRMAGKCWTWVAAPKFWQGWPIGPDKLYQGSASSHRKFYDYDAATASEEGFKNSFARSFGSEPWGMAF